VVTTAKLLRRQGYHGTGLNQIVAEADAPKGSMYFHFPGGKEQLAAEAIRASAEYLDRALLACEGPTALASLERWVAEVAKALERSNFEDGCPIATVALEASTSSEALGDACAEAVERLLGRVAGWLERDGFSRSAARQRAELVYAAIEGAEMFAKARRSVEPMLTLRRQLPFLLRQDERASGLSRVRPTPGRARA
jgi:TetR/AcrR family transcriptional repressor of lmrAB and yxaGH operons